MFYLGASYVFAMASISEQRKVNVPLLLAAGYVRQYIREVFTKHNGLLTLSVATSTRRRSREIPTTMVSVFLGRGLR